MKYFTSLTYFILAFPIDISNVFMNIFIIYALRKLKKLNNISFWLLYWLSISDLFVGLSGFTLDISFISCLSRFSCYWFRYIYAMRSYFIGYSARLTTIVAIDRSIRMKYLYKYNTIMTKTKADMVLLVNVAIGIVRFVGSFGSLIVTFEMAYGIFHTVCIFSGCILYIITYCITKKKVSDLHSNMQQGQIITVKEATTHPNMPVSLLQPNAHDVAEGILIHGSSRGRSTSQTTLHSFGCHERNSERNQLAVSGKVSLGSNSLSNETPERSMEIKPSVNDVARKCVPSKNNNTVDQSRNPRVKAETKMNNPKDPNHRRRNDNEVGRAMLFITMAMISCYVPIVVDNLLLMQNIESAVLDHFAMLLLPANATCNAIILTVFSRDIRNLAKRLL